MRKNTTMVLLFLSLSVSANAFCDPILENMDKITTKPFYKKIAYLSYKHKKKKEYLEKTFKFLSELRKENANMKRVISYTADRAATNKLPEAASLELDGINASNKVSISVLQTMIYSDIKKEVKETFDK